MAATILTAHAPVVAFIPASSGYGGYDVLDEFGQCIGHITMSRGFAHYTGKPGTAHGGMGAVIRSGRDLEDVRIALANGIHNGRDDRNA